MMKTNQNVVILGASSNPERYSNKAIRLLSKKGHTVFPIHPEESEIEGLIVYPDLASIPVGIDTLSIYINPSISSVLKHDIAAVHPGRVILNPGTENKELEIILEQECIPCFHACTLVLLRMGKFQYMEWI